MPRIDGIIPLLAAGLSPVQRPEVAQVRAPSNSACP